MGAIGKLAMTAADTLTGGLASGVLGMFLGKHNDNRQIEQQQKLTDMQLQADKQKTDYQYQKQMDMWENTNYNAQKQQLQKAGLNPGLLYGMSGGGGTTTGGGSASVSAPSAQGTSNEIMGMMQLRTQEAQIELMKAQATEALADAKKKGGVDTENVATNTANIKQQTENAILEGVIKKYTGMDMQKTYEAKEKTDQWTQQARTEWMKSAAEYGVAETMSQLYEEGKIKDKSNAEIEQIMLQNSKTREETKNIIKTFDLLEENIKGQQLNNIIQEAEAKWRSNTTLSSGNIMEFIGKLLQSLILRR